MSFIFDGLILATGWVYVLLAPFTKVEESFSLHATHDVLLYGIHPTKLEHYDHLINPGPVKRTFVGSLLLAWVSMPIMQLANRFEHMSSKFDMQIIVRLVLATLNGIGLSLIRRAVARRFGRPTSLFFAILTISQFHLPFWMGRTVPNMFALVPVNYATYLLLDRSSNSRRPAPESILRAIGILTFSGIVFRSEIVLLLAPVALQALIMGQVGLVELVWTGIVSSLVAMSITVGIDSYFWAENNTWPEYDSFYFNVVEGKSADWGTSPATTYVKVFLPKLLLSCLPLAVIGFFLDKRIRGLMTPCLAFVGLISALGHKEWRFIVYIVPIFNVGAARSVRWLVSRPKSSLFGRITLLMACGAIVANFAVTYIIAASSIPNYPGGEALVIFNERCAQARESVFVRPPHVHISNLAAQTGASMFLQTHTLPFPSPAYINANQQLFADEKAPWTYNKTEKIGFDERIASSHFTHLIAETTDVEESLNKRSTQKVLDAEWRKIAEVEGFVGWQVDDEIWNLWRDGRRGKEGRKEFPARLKKIWNGAERSLVRMKKVPMLVLYERKGWADGK